MEEIQNLLHQKLITKMNIFYKKVLRPHLVMENPKPIKPTKTLQDLDPYVIAKVVVLFACQTL